MNLDKTLSPETPSDPDQRGLLIEDVVIGSPAHVAGVKKGEEITHVDYQPIRVEHVNLTMDEGVNLLNLGGNKQEVTLTVRTPGGEFRSVTVKRELRDGRYFFGVAGMNIPHREMRISGDKYKTETYPNREFSVMEERYGLRDRAGAPFTVVMKYAMLPEFGTNIHKLQVLRLITNFALIAPDGRRIDIPVQAMDLECHYTLENDILYVLAHAGLLKVLKEHKRDSPEFNPKNIKQEAIRLVEQIRAETGIEFGPQDNSVIEATDALKDRVNNVIGNEGK